MKKIVLRYGAWSALGQLLTFVLAFLVIRFFNPGPDAQGNIGYVAIISPLVFIYFAIRYYRDVVNQGRITFLKAIQVGLLVSIMPAFGYALIETIYVLYIDPKFYENIYTYEIAQLRKSLPAAEFQQKVKEIKASLILDKNPLYNFTIMVFTIGALGIIITLVSSLLLMKKTSRQKINQ